MSDELIDRIYEAAFQPECWRPLLRDIGLTTRSVSGLLIVFDEARPIQFKGTPLVHGIMEEISDEQWRDSPRAGYTARNPFSGFVVLNDYIPAELMNADPCRGHLVEAGLDSEASAVIPMPTGEMVVYSFGRRREDGPHGTREIEVLNAFHSHLARAGMMAAQLGLERAKATTTTLQAIGLPAAVLGATGRVLSANDLFERLTNLFMPVAFGRMAIADIGANRLLQQAIESGLDATERVRSIPIGKKEGREACVVHIVPLRRSAYDLFPGGDMIVAVTALRKSSLVPSPRVLMGLFDLTPAETRFAIAMMSGASLQEAARGLGITESSGRTYLARIFEKTGTHRQAELTALLRATHPFE